MGLRNSSASRSERRLQAESRRTLYDCARPGVEGTAGAFVEGVSATTASVTMEAGPRLVPVLDTADAEGDADDH
jgi:hypothetical protein